MAAMPRFTPTGKRADIAKITTPKQRPKTPCFPRFPGGPARGSNHTASARAARLRAASQAKSAPAMKMVGKITSLTACQPK